MSKRFLTFFIGVVVAILAVGLFLALLRGSEDTWLCRDGEWVKHGNPAAPMPNKPCKGVGSGAGGTELAGGKVVLDTPKPDDLLQTPFIVEGRAKGSWFFEASFPVKLKDQSGKEIAIAIAQAQGDWMTSDFVPFKARLDFAVQNNTDAVLVLEKDNPSGLPELDEQASISVKLKAAEALLGLDLPDSEAMTVKVFFNNSQLDPEFSCNKVFPIERKIAKTETSARKALELLLEGALTFEEQQQGFGTSINPGVKIQKLTIENGIARVDFDEQLEFQVGGSCRVAAIHWQIVETLKQFPAVQDVVISINGRTEDILQP